MNFKRFYLFLFYYLNFFFQIILTNELKWNNFRDLYKSSELYFIIETVEYAQEIFHSAELMNQIIIVWLTYEHELDPYLKLYMEYVLELMKYTNSINIIIHSSEKDIHLVPNILKILPEKSIYIIIDDADLRLNVCTLYAVTDMLSDRVPVIFHLNHEMPWTDTHIGITPEGEMCNSFNLPQIYQNYKYVFRNYYHSSFLQSAQYVPLLTKQQRKLHEFRSNNPILPSSKREHWCIFSGRVTYNHLRSIESIFHQERNELLRLITQSSSSVSSPESQISSISQCRAYYNDNGTDGHQHTFSEYVAILSQTVFTPCPAGNNPETFRHYEVWI